MPYTDPEKKRRAQREWHARNRERRNAEMKEWQSRNKERISAYNKTYRAKHRPSEQQALEEARARAAVRLGIRELKKALRELAIECNRQS